MQVDAADVEAQLRQVPRFRDASWLTWQPLPGGLSNCTLRVLADDDAFAVRLPAGRRAAGSGQSARNEWQVLIETSARGLAPLPEWADERSGLLVTHFETGPVWTLSQVRDSANWPRLAALLRRVHAIDLALPAFAPVAAADHYWAQYARHGEPSSRARRSWRSFLAERDLLQDALNPCCLCHNDVMFSNLVGDRPVLLDWEYAARSDPLFDLATVVVYHDFSAAMGEALLDEYLGQRDSVELARLDVLCRLCRYVSWLWNLARLGREPGARDWSVALPG